MKPSYPNLRNLADRASTHAQKLYLRLSVSQLILLIITALLAGASVDDTAKKKIIAWLICCLMLGSLTCSVGLRTGLFEIRWFKCRAFAENAKSLVWRYIMFPSDCGYGESEYIADWSALRKRLPELQKDFALSSEAGELLTDWMLNMKALSLAEKVTLYRDMRLNDQRKWYSKNSKSNRRNHLAFFWTILILESVVMLIAAAQAFLLLPINIVGFVATTTGCLIAWSQTKRFSELATTYAVAAEDLVEISAKFRIVDDKQVLIEFVEDVEDAISREHTMWLSRRDC